MDIREPSAKDLRNWRKCIEWTADQPPLDPNIWTRYWRVTAWNLMQEGKTEQAEMAASMINPPGP